MRAVSLVLGVGLAVVVVAIPSWYRSVESVRYRNLRVVREGQLYRSGTMTPNGFARTVRELGVGTVISLRDRKDGSGSFADQFEADFCAANGITFHRIEPEDWSPVNGEIPGENMLREFLEILDDPKTRRPVLIHCFAGVHRTGAHCAAYRMEYEGWTPDEAIAEMRAIGGPRNTFADNLITYLSRYQPGRLRPRTVGSAAGLR